MTNKIQRSRLLEGLRAKGKELALYVDDSKGSAFDPKASACWSYETDWALFQPYADVVRSSQPSSSTWEPVRIIVPHNYMAADGCLLAAPCYARRLSGCCTDVCENCM
jgi:hypothetical protein